MRLIDPEKIPKMGEPTTLENTPMYEFAQCLVDYLVENYGVDVPDIVRCKDCKWYSQVTSMTGKLLSEGRCEYHSNYFAEDDYCSRGERKESE